MKKSAGLIWSVFLGMLLAGSFAETETVAAEVSCRLDFEVIADNAIGTIGPGERLQGQIAFTSQSSWRQDRETVSYAATGTMRLGVPDRGVVTGQIRVVHVIRTPYTADYISIDAAQVSGTLGGERSYADPMLLTLYAAPKTLTSSELPRTQADWNQLAKRRVFQVHTPTPMQIFIGAVDKVFGTCE